MPPVNDKLEATTKLWYISPHNFCDEVRSQMMLPKKVQICDMTLREGRQLEGLSLRQDEVVLLAEKLAEAGVTMLQVHGDDPEDVLEIKKRLPNVMVEAMIHPTAGLDPATCKQAVDEIVDHRVDIVNLSFSFSDPQMPVYETMAGARISREEAIDRAVNAVSYAKSKSEGVSFLIQDPMRMDLGLLKSIVRKMVDAGATIIRLDDIVGQAIYPAYRYVFREMKKAFPDVRFAFHVHNDFGMGAAALYAALEGGAEILDVCVNGLGERAGVAPLAEVAAVVQIGYGLDAGIKLEKMKELSQLVADITKWPVPPKMPCVGDQAFSDVVEVHYSQPPDGEWAYRQWKAEIFGNRTRTLLGRYSGPWAIRSKARELGVTIPDEKVQAVLERIRSEFRWRKRGLQDEEFRRIVKELD